MSDFRKKQEAGSERVLVAAKSVRGSSETFAKNSSYKSRIFSSIKGTQYEAAMNECDNGGSACGSVFCDRCKHRKSMNMYQAYKRHCEKAFGNDEVVARERLRWVTVLHSLVPVSYESSEISNECVNQIKSDVEKMKGYISNVGRTARRKHGTDIWLRGGVHAELIDYEMFQFAHLAGKKTTKQNTLSGFIDAALPPGKVVDRYFLVHFHALADTGGMSDRDFKDLFANHWSLTEKQLHIQRTCSLIKLKGMRKAIKQTLDNGLLGMSRYCFTGSNSRLQYARNWGAGKVVFQSGEEVNGCSGIIGFAEEVNDHTFDEQLSKTDIRLLVSAHNEIGGVDSHRGLVVGIY